MKDYVVVIPARYESSRLPGKPLIVLKGKSMLLRTFERCVLAVDANLIYVATDDKRIVKHCEDFGIQVVLTSKNCLTGTDRVAEFSNVIDSKTYINVQGDEPIIDPSDILEVIKVSKAYRQDVINGYTPIKTDAYYKSLSIPKVVFRPDGRLLYMSRSPIPGNKLGGFKKSWRQICVYAFPKEALTEFSKQNKKTTLEKEEDIEILRFLELGYEVRMIQLSGNSIAVDTPEDAEKVRSLLEEKKQDG